MTNRRENKRNTTRVAAGKGRGKGGKRLRMADFTAYAVLVTVLLVMLSSRLAAELYARFSSGSDGGDGAVAAAWDVHMGELSPLDGEIMADGEDAAACVFTVTSASQVALTYELEVSNVQEGAKVTLTADGETIERTVVNNKCCFTDPSVLRFGSAGESVLSREHTLTFTAGGEVPAEKREIRVTMRAFQTD